MENNKVNISGCVHHLQSELVLIAYSLMTCIEQLLYQYGHSDLSVVSKHRRLFPITQTYNIMLDAAAKLDLTIKRRITYFVY